MDCIFCKIIKGEIPAVKVYEDNDVLAFLDIHPVSRGHCLVVPKQHAQDVFDMPDNVLEKVAVAGKKIAKSIKENLKADGINFLQSNGALAGQVIFHYHLHIIGRFADDGLKTRGFFGEREQHPTSQELEAIADAIRIS